jgi:HIP---CoA ligase
MTDAKTIPGVLIETARKRPDHPAIIDRGQSLTYSELASRTKHFAASLVLAGMRKGESVGIWLPNCAEWVVAAMGVQAAGGVIVPLSTRYKGTEVAHALNRTGARFLIHAETFLGTDYLAILAGIELPQIEHRITVDLASIGQHEMARWLRRGGTDAEALAEVELRLATLKPDDVSDVIFTSGTTGVPKGVVTSHGQNVATYVEWVRATTLGPDDRYLLIWPMSHCSGYKSGWLASAIAGSTLYPEATLDIDRLVERCLAEQITFLPGPPPLFQSCCPPHPARAENLPRFA